MDFYVKSADADVNRVVLYTWALLNLRLIKSIVLSYSKIQPSDC